MGAANYSKKPKNEEQRADGKLTPKQELLIEEYFKDFNARQALVRAGYSEKSAMYQTFSLPIIQDAIHKKMQERKEQYKITHEQIIEELKIVAFSDIGEFFVVDYDRNGNQHLRFNGERALKNGKGKAVKSIEVDNKTGKTRITMNNKEFALEMLAKHVGFFKEDNEQRKVDTIKIFIPDNNRDGKSLGQGEIIDITPSGE